MGLKFLGYGMIAFCLISAIRTEEAAKTDPAPNTDSPPEGEAAGAEGGAGGEAAAADAQTGAAPPKNVVKCKNHLLQTYGLEGLEYSKEMKLDMCGGVQNSCCKTADQLAIFDNWIGAEEGKQLRERLDYHFKVYSELILELERAVPIASTLLSLTGQKVVSNCKLLSRRVLEYNINMVGPRLKEALRAMHAFFQDTYKGAYCSLCNADYQSFFHVEDKTITVSPQFCRSIVANSLHVLTYYHVHMKRLSNLVAIMLTSCDEKGAFVPEITVPVDLNFVVDDVAQRELYDCLQFRDDPKWLAYCGHICEEFHLSRFSEFFQPDLVRYKRLTKFLQTKFDKFLSQEQKDLKQKAEVAKEGAKKEGAEEKKEEKKAERILQRAKFVRDPRVLEDAEGEGGEKKEEEKKEEEKPKEGEEAKEEKGDKPEEGKEGDEAEQKPADEQPKVDPSDDNPANIMDLKIEWEDLNVIRRTINAISPLERFDSICGAEGIDPYEMGKQTQVNEAVYETVKKLVELENKKPEPKPEAPKKPSGGFTSFVKSLFGA